MVAWLGCKSPKWKKFTSMEPEQRHVIKLLLLKSLKLEEIATERSTTHRGMRAPVRA
jgi:hypothetical protein